MDAAKKISAAFGKETIKEVKPVKKVQAAAKPTAAEPEASKEPGKKKSNWYMWKKK